MTHHSNLTNNAPAGRPEAFHVMTKPVGPICNLGCKYCFYLEKERLFPPSEKFRMSDDLLEAYIKQYIEGQSTAEITFGWQGGEPTLLGVEFFQKVVDLQKKYANGKAIHNSLQTNGTLLDDCWAEFFAAHGFLIGLSVDGPARLHDVYRVDKRQRPTFDLVMRGLEFLKKHRVEFNTLTVVNRANAKHPLEVYRFLKEINSGFLQFIPLVERKPDHAANELGLDLATPPGAENMDSSPVTSWSVEASSYGDFLVAIFDDWVRHDVGRTFVQLFDVALGIWYGQPSTLCVFSETCGTALALEHNGDLYACDHYVYPRYKLGNIQETTLGDMVLSPQQRKFGADKRDTLPKYCRECTVRFACNGECPKHRFILTPDGDPGLNYLCAAYKRFFTHIDPYMRTMADLLRTGSAPAKIMSLPVVAPGRHDPCPCGSGKKFKNCCG